jgi:nitroreductase
MIIETIKMRHSTRRFASHVLSEDEKSRIIEFFKSLPSLHSRRLDWQLRDLGKGSGTIFAACMDKPNCLVEYGFQGEIIVLELTKQNYASCWNAGIKETAAPAGIVIGKEEPGKFSINDLITNMGRRKELSSLVEGTLPEDERFLQILEACRLAPSSLNRQPWRFAFHNNELYIWTKPSILGEHHWIELGIALSHAFLVAQEFFTRVVIEKASGDRYRLVIK